MENEDAVRVVRILFLTRHPVFLLENFPDEFVPGSLRLDLGYLTSAYEQLKGPSLIDARSGAPGNFADVHNFGSCRKNFYV